MKYTLEQILDYLKLEKPSDIDLGFQVSDLGFSKESSSDSIFVVHQNTHLNFALESKAKVLILDEKIKSSVQSKPEKIIIFVKQPYVVFAQLTKLFFSDRDFCWDFTETKDNKSFVSESAKIGKNVSLAPGCVVYPGAEVGDGCFLGANVVVGQKTKIGAFSVIFPNVTIYPHTEIGNHVRIHSGTVLGSDGFGFAKAGTKNVKIFHGGKLKIGNFVEIGSNTAIDRGTLGDTIIEDGVVIDNEVQIGHNCKIGQDSVICGMVGIPGGVEIGKCVVVGGLTGFNNRVKVGDFSQIGGMTAVSKDLPPHSHVIGRPMNTLKQFYKSHILIDRLEEFYERFKRLENEMANK